MRKGIVRSFDADVRRLGHVEVPGLSCEGSIIIECGTIAHSVVLGIVRLLPEGEEPTWPLPGDDVLLGALRPEGINLRALYWCRPTPRPPIDKIARPGRKSQRLVARKEELRSGVIKYFNAARLYGFIIPDDGGEDVFIHTSGAADLAEDGGLRLRTPDQTGIIPREGQRMLYAPIAFEAKIRADLWHVQ